MQQHTANPVPSFARLRNTSAQQRLQATTRLGVSLGFCNPRYPKHCRAQKAKHQQLSGSLTATNEAFLVHHLPYDDVASLRRFALCAEQVCTDSGNLGHAFLATLLRG